MTGYVYIIHMYKERSHVFGCFVFYLGFIFLFQGNFSGVVFTGLIDGDNVASTAMGSIVHLF